MDEPKRLKSTTTRNIDAYALDYLGPVNKRLDSQKQKQAKRMSLTCKSCGKSFDSTFTEEEFALLPRDQNETGTLHLCPLCGNLSTYLLKDYREP
ncbi:MAG: hypothetical protein ACREBS_02480 [Nitrososphaerales archaeon]